jgi:class 3 adenylate cyclase
LSLPLSRSCEGYIGAETSAKWGGLDPISRWNRDFPAGRAGEAVYAKRGIKEADLTSERLDRRLSAILAADVAGYSRLMGLDEEGTVGQVKNHQVNLIDPKIAEHRGRVVRTTGDGILSEFASAVDAVRCAVDIQLSMASANLNGRRRVGQQQRHFHS